MKRFTKLGLIALTALVLFTGCDTEGRYQDTTSTTTVTNMSYGVNVYCDKDTNVEYLIFKGYDGNGMNVRYNLDGTIKSCK
jgi:hypothetical protein